MRVGITGTSMWTENSYRNAGISRVTFRLIEQLSCRNPGDRFTLFANDQFEPPGRWAELDNLEVRAICPSGRGRKAIWENFGAGRLADPARFDAWLSTAHSVPFRSKVPAATFIHDMIPLSHPEFQERAQSTYLCFALRYAARRSDRILTNSETTKVDIVRFAGVAADKIAVVPLGPGSDARPISRDEIDPAALQDIPFPRFLFALGTLEPRKNIVSLLRAMALLRERNVLGDVGLAIAGGRGWKEQGIFETLAELKIEDRVAFLGYVEDSRLPALFGACEAFVFPSLFEGFGMPILEAMAMGAPVLTSGCGAMREVGGEVAIYFDPTSPEDIARVIAQHVLNRSGPRDTQVEQGIARANEFTWESAADAVMRVLKEMSGQALPQSA